MDPVSESWRLNISLSTVEACRKEHAAKACTKATCLIVRHIHTSMYVLVREKQREVLLQ